MFGKGIHLGLENMNMITQGNAFCVCKKSPTGFYICPSKPAFSMLDLVIGYNILSIAQWQLLRQLLGHDCHCKRVDHIEDLIPKGCVHMYDRESKSCANGNKS